MSAGRRPWMFVVVVQGCVIAALAILAAWLGRDELKLYESRPESEVAAPSRVAARDGLSSVKVSAAAQRASGIAVAPVPAHTLAHETVWYGSVVGAQPLEEARARLLAAEKEVAVVEPQVRRAEEEFRRVRGLYRDDRSASERAMQAAEADYKGERARLEAARERVESARASIVAQWGETIARRIAGTGRRGAPALANGEESLIRIAAGVGAGDDPPAELDVAPIGDDRRARKARLLSVAPQAEGASGGRTWFYVVRHPDLRAGMRVVGRAADGSGTRGVVVPASAVVWHGGKSWVYVRSGDAEFSRREIAARDSVGDAWFVAGALKPGESVVTSGAQLLLSEEFRFQIKNENTD